VVSVQALGQVQLKQIFSDREIRSIQGNGQTYKAIVNTIDRNKRGDSYHIMGTRRILGGINALLRVKPDDNLIVFQKKLIEAIFDSAKPSSQLKSKSNFNDEYRGWISLTKGRSYLEEVPLYESYSFFYIAEFLYWLKKSGWANENSENAKWWKDKLNFLEKNGWEKWLTRSKKKYGKNYTYFLRSQTHMGSHWAGVALFLEKISDNDLIRTQAKELYTSYDMLLKRNFKVVNNSYIWNSTYDDVSGTDAIASTTRRVQDTSHGNHVVSYIIVANELGNESWNNRDITLLISTFKQTVYNSNNRSFNSYIDGLEEQKDRSRFFVGDGWVKLSRYDNDLKELFTQYSKDSDKMSVSHQEFQFNCNLIEAKSYSK